MILRPFPLKKKGLFFESLLWIYIVILRRLEELFERRSRRSLMVLVKNFKGFFQFEKYLKLVMLSIPISK